MPANDRRRAHAWQLHDRCQGLVERAFFGGRRSTVSEAVSRIA